MGLYMQGEKFIHEALQIEATSTITRLGIVILAKPVWKKARHSFIRSQIVSTF